MKQKLITAAVAGAFALPGVALAQVTISGTFEAGLTQGKVSEPAAARAGLNTSNTYVANAAAMRFGMTEDLGRGTSFFGLWEIRPILDGGTVTGDALAVGSTTPQAFIGLRNNSWGSFRIGNMSFWASKGEIASPRAFHYGYQNLSSYQQITGTGAVTSVIAGRQRNLMWYEMPKMGGLGLGVAYSTSNNANDSDLTVGTRKGSSYYLAPEYDAGVVKFGWTHANQKADGATSHYKGNKLYANGKIGPVTAGIGYVTWKGESAAAANNLNTKSWFLPVTYVTGPHTFGVALSKASDNKNVAGDQSAKQTAMAYNYALSKRTSVSLSHVRLKNSAGAAYDLSNLTGTMDGVTSFTSGLGEDLTTTTVGLHHSF